MSESGTTQSGNSVSVRPKGGLPFGKSLSKLTGEGDLNLGLEQFMDNKYARAALHMNPMAGGPVRSAIDIFAPKAGKYIDKFEGNLKGVGLRGFLEGGPSGAVSAMTSRATDLAKDLGKRGLRKATKLARNLSSKGIKEVASLSKKGFNQVKKQGKNAARKIKHVAEDAFDSISGLFS
jgi:hypothetical protein